MRLVSPHASDCSPCQTLHMGWWRVVRTENGLRLAPRWVIRSHLPDLLPSLLWPRGSVLLGGRLHFCVGHLDSVHRTIEWKSTDWLVGYRTYVGPHRERETNPFDDPDSYADE